MFTESSNKVAFGRNVSLAGPRQFACMLGYCPPQLFPTMFRVPRYECIRLVRANGRRESVSTAFASLSLSFANYSAINQFRKRRDPPPRWNGQTAYANVGVTQLIIPRPEGYA